MPLKQFSNSESPLTESDHKESSHFVVFLDLKNPSVLHKVISGAILLIDITTDEEKKKHAWTISNKSIKCIEWDEIPEFNAEEQHCWKPKSDVGKTWKFDKYETK